MYFSTWISSLRINSRYRFSLQIGENAISINTSNNLQATLFRGSSSYEMASVIISKLNSPHEVCTVQKFQQHNSCGISVGKHRGFRKDLHYLGLYGIQLFGTPAEDQPISPQYHECDDVTLKLFRPFLERLSVFWFYWWLTIKNEFWLYHICLIKVFQFPFYLHTF